MATLVSRTENTASALARRMSQARDEVDAAADAVAVDGGDHGLRAVGHRRDRSLHALDARPGRPRPATAIEGGPSPVAVRSSPVARAVAAGEQAGHGLEVEADAEMRTAGRDHHGPDVACRPTARSWPRGRSSQKAGPMALRASGRSSHTVATWPSRSMLSTSRSGIATSLRPPVAPVRRPRRCAGRHARQDARPRVACAAAPVPFERGRP